MRRPNQGDRRPGTPAEAVSMETAKAACEPPNTSSGSEYILTLKPATAKKLSEIPAAPHRAEGAEGMAAVASARTAESRQSRNRASGGATPRSISWRDSQPPVKPPAPAKTGGIHAYQ